MKPKRPIRNRIPLCLLLGGLLASEAAAQRQISWGTSLPFDTMVIHDGSELVPADFIVELGTFTPGFVPSLANAADWETNWKTFDAITNPDSDPNGSDGFTDHPGSNAVFSGAAYLLPNQESDSEDATAGETFLAGVDQAYVWLYNKTAIEGDTEWALYTNLLGAGPTADPQWEFPSGGGGPGSFPLLWFISAADTAVVGAIHGGSANPAYTGDGYSTDTSTDYLIRTHRLIPMPEPGTWLLLLLGAAPLLRRKRI